MRERKVHTDYISAAKELDKKYRGAQGGQAGPVEQRLCQCRESPRNCARHLRRRISRSHRSVRPRCGRSRTRAPAVLRRHPWPSQSHVRPPDPSPMGQYGNKRLGKAGC
jgi:hypothetical protein